MTRPPLPSMVGATVVVTGANSGVGLATCVGLAALGARVIGTSRDTAKGERAAAEIRSRSGSDRVEMRHLDLADLATVESFAVRLREEVSRVDVLVNNAGVVLDRRLPTAQGFEMAFGVNHLGHMFLTDRLVPALMPSSAGPARVVTVASGAHHGAPVGITWGNLDRRHGRYSAMGVYAQSKLANILFTRELARRWESHERVAHAVHPGGVRTNLGREGDTRNGDRVASLIGRFMISPERGARTSIHVAASPEAGECTGRYWVRRRPWFTSFAARSESQAGRLWDVSSDLLATAGYPLAHLGGP